MIDGEDIIKSLISYLTEDLGGGISRINQAITDSNTCKGDVLLPAVSNDIILGQRLQEVNVFQKGHLNIDIKSDIEAESKFNKVAKTYEVTVSYIRKDSFAKEIYFAGLRMEGVITKVMESYLETKREAGFIDGDIVGCFTPERVLLGNTTEKAITSGVIYSIVIF